METRTLLFAGGAFLVCAVLGAVLLSDGDALPSLPGGGGAPMLVRVENAGPREANALFEVSEREGDFTTRSSRPPPGSGSRARRIARALSGDVFTKVTVTWSGASREARGDQAIFVDPSTCRSGETMVVTFHVDTTNGVAFGRSERDCARV